jgi:gliding motility-associated-like protein
MKKNTLIAFFIFLPLFIYSQQCPDPVADSPQYFCTGASPILDDLTVTATGDLTWYDDATASNPPLPGTTPIVHGTTYYVSNTEPGGVCTESNLIPITVKLQSIHFDVSPKSCINLGDNIFVVDPSDIVTIYALDINGDTLVDQPIWRKTGTANPWGEPLYFDSGLGNPNFQWGYNPTYFNGEPNKRYDFSATTNTSQGGCPATVQNFTILTGAWIYDQYCHGANTTLDDLGLPGNNHSWYDDPAGNNSISGNTIVEGNTTYYAGFNDPNCPDLLPVIIEYKVEPPSGQNEYFFCTGDTYAASGMISFPGDMLSDLTICGQNLKWYDSTMTSLPSSTFLEDGEIYYVTQTINGCESEPLEVIVEERTCACAKNTGFETQDGEADTTGVTIFHNPISGNYPNFQVCNITFLYNNPIALGPPESPSACTQYSTYASIVTAGNDPTLMCMGIPFPRTSPLGDTCSKFSMRLNRNIPNTSQNSGIVTMRKEMIAGEVLAFDFAILMENPVHHIPTQTEPFFQVKVYDMNNNVIEERCIKANNGDCILNEEPNLPGSPYTLLYSNWSCVKMNTREVQGQKIRVEFSASTCQPDFHFSYVYVDNIYVGDDGPDICSSPSFGYLAVEPVENAVSDPDYEPCSLIEEIDSDNCSPAVPVLNPVFPIEVCGTFSTPIIAPGNNGTITPGTVELKIFKNNTQVGQTTTLNSSTTSSFCYEVDYPRDFNQGTPLYGYFSVEATTIYEMNCGLIYDFPLKSMVDIFKFCPVAACPPDMAVCNNDPTMTQATFDLTLQDSIIGANYLPHEYSVSYYTSEADAHAGVGAIPSTGTGQTTSAYTVNSPGTYDIYARLDFNWAGLNAGPQPEDCYDVVMFELFAGQAPDVPSDFDVVVGPLELCPDPALTDYEFDLTEVETYLTSNLSPVSDYSWTYYDDAQIIPQNEISDPDAYIANISPGQTDTIYIRVTGPDDCFIVVSFDIVIHPEINFNIPTHYELCDDAVADGFTQFDLNTMVTQMTNNDPNLDVTFHADETDAETGVSALPLNHTNTSNPQTIYVRIEDSATDCFIITEFDLIVNPNPEPGMVNDMLLCDTSGNGTAPFDLTVPEAEILNGQTGFTVNFYTSQAAADAGGTTNALPTPYTNTSNPQTIYFRIEDDVTGCYATGNFDLEVVSNPPITDPITDLKLCDNDGDGTEDFDLTLKEPEILNTIAPGSVDITYHNSSADANNATNPIADPTAYPSTGNEVIYVRVEYTVGGGCYSVGQFNLMFHDPVAFNPPQPLIVCDTGSGTGMVPFDLSLATTQITGNDPNLDVTYYLTDSEAHTGNPGDQLNSPFTNTTPYNQTIYVRIEDKTTGCYAVAPLDLQVNEAPVANIPDPLTYCDEDNDGLGSFTLTDADLQITGGVAGVNVTYHVTLADANNNVLPLASPFYNTVPYLQIIYARVESAGVACYSVVELELKVLDSPQIEAPDDLVECDFNGNGTGLFDLTVVEPQVMINIPNPSDYTIRYFATLTDLNNNNSIPVPTAYTSITNPQTIYVVVSDDDNGCSNQVEFEISVVDMPNIFHPDPLELCDVNNPNDGIEEFNLNMATSQITGGDTSISITYHETQADADAGINPLPALYTNIINNQTIYIRAESSEGCVITEGYTLTLIVNPQPSPREPEPLEVCDPSSDGFAWFDLELATQYIRNNEPNTVVTYHETLSDANLGIFALTSPYANVVAYNQTVYARSEFTTTGCFAVVELELIVHDTPDVPVILPEIVVCSEDPFIDTGILFDLTVNETVIYGVQNPADFDLTYHETEQSAIDNIQPISDPQNYFNISNPQDIWVRLGNTDTECGTVRKMTLIVEMAPEIGGPFRMEVCGDGETAEFDLSTMYNDFTLGQLGMDVQYYVDEDDALQGINPINPDYAFTNTSNPQTIYVRVVDGDNGCASHTTLTLVVNSNPDIETPEPIELCDVDGTGFMEFDLTIREAEILNGEVGDFTYHLTYEDAEDNVNPILDPSSYVNVETPQQIIYVRVTNSETGCYTIVELLLIVNPLPILDGDISDYIICELDTDGRALFDLTTKIPEILNGQSPFVFDVKFYEDQNDADNGVNAIVTPDAFFNQTNPQEIFVRIENRDTECFVSGGSFFLRVMEGVVANEPAEPFKICDNLMPSDGIAEFDLEDFSLQKVVDFRNEILNNQDPSIYSLHFYESYDEAVAGENPIVWPYINVINPQIIYARVTNEDNPWEPQCYEIVEVILLVEELPEIYFEDQYRLCVDAEGNPLTEEFGETSPPLIDTFLDPELFTFEWTHNGVIIPGEEGPSIIATEAGEYVVTATHIESGCVTIGTATVVLSSPPLTYNAITTTDAFSSVHIVEVSASGLGEYEFQFNDEPFQDGTVFYDVPAGSHIITIRDKNGCGSVRIPVGVVDYPLFFTPNGDNYNDTWNIYGMGELDPNAKIYIFDRYGKLLKQLVPGGEGWDGTHNGNPMPSSDYWFRVEYMEHDMPKQIKGHFSLKR